MISMSQYFSANLEIAVRQATDGKKMIAAAPEIYSPRVSRVGCVKFPMNVVTLKAYYKTRN